MSNQWKIGAITALAGAIAGGAVALLAPARYISSAVLQIHPASAPGATEQQQRSEARRRFARVEQEVLSRGSLAETIQRPSLDLYRRERARMPMEDIIQTMRTHDIRIESSGAQNATDLRLRVSFEYPDRDVAPAVIRELVKKLREQNIAAGGTLEAIEMPQGPGQSTRSLPAAIGIGLGVGALIGPLVLLLRRRSWKWYLLVFGFAIAGGLAAEWASFYGEFFYPDDAELGLLGLCAGAAVGIFLLRRRGRTRGNVEVAIAATAAGAIVAGLISFAMPDQWESKAVVRIFPQPAQGAAVPERRPDAAERIAQLTDDALSRSALVELIQRPALDLYRARRARVPLEEVVEIMRTRDLRIAQVIPGDPEAGLDITFRYPDRYKAQQVARELVSRFMEQNTNLERRAGGGQGVPGSLLMEILDLASLPERPVAPDRLLVTGLGAAVGLMASLLTVFVRRQSPPRRMAMLRFALGTGAAGACVAAVIAFAIPSRYLSTAVLRIVQPSSGARDQSIAEDLQMRIANVASASGLTEIIQRPSLNLYASERARQPIKDVIQQIRARDLRIETLKVSGSGLTESVRISFEYPDRVKAHEMVRAVVSLLVEGTVSHPGADMQAKSAAELSRPLAAAATSMTSESVPSPPRAPSPLESFSGTGGSSPPRQPPPVTAAYVEVLDPPSVPEAPELPNRANIVSLGLVAGLLLGPVAALLRREAHPATA